MTSTPLLTIVVPTYNRASCLELLLSTLVRETTGMAGRVAVVVGDNASTDRTAEVTRAFQALVPSARVLRHAENLGPDENFCRCLEQTTSKYFWIIGDDDLPRAGAVGRLLALLAAQSPDLVYLESDWRPELVDNEPDDPVRDEGAIVMDRMSFARRVHVWTTFISGMVVNRESYVATHGADSLRRYSNTNLVQLGWVLGTLAAGHRFIVIGQKYVLATQGNTGGYRVLTVFGKNFPTVVDDALGASSPLSRAIIRRSTLTYLPNLIWNLRFSTVGAFEHEGVDEALRPRLGGSLGFWLLLRPIGYWKRAGATFVLRVSNLAARFIRVQDRLLARRAGVARIAA